MKPDRSNYEIWLIDWLDGNLNEVQVGQLMEFLDSNPDLKEEADSLSGSRLSPAENLFCSKEKLRKTATDLPHTQIEYLSVAWLENDISHEQMEDLKQNIDSTPENKTIFESLQKIRLKPMEYIYKDKIHLKKLTTGQKVFRLSIITLSAAATITIIILSYFLAPRLIPDKKYQSAQNIIADTTPKVPFIVRTKVFKVKPDQFDRLKDITEVDFNPTPVIAVNDLSEQTVNLATVDSSSIIKASSGIEIPKIPALFKANLKEEMLFNTLIATNNAFTEPLYDGRSRLSKFIARTFRDKILKEDISNDAPIRSYEIAEAGIEGLNKLFGWEMALVKNTDSEGELKSVYFSSKVLKFNAPIKKTEVYQ